VPAVDYMTVYAGTLDDSPHLTPDGHIWTQDAQPWIVLPKDVPCFAQGAPDLEPLIQSRKARLAAAKTA
jgi:hypothetical protein